MESGVRRDSVRFNRESREHGTSTSLADVLAAPHDSPVLLDADVRIRRRRVRGRSRDRLARRARQARAMAWKLAGRRPAPDRTGRSRTPTIGFARRFSLQSPTTPTRGSMASDISWKRMPACCSYRAASAGRNRSLASCIPRTKASSVPAWNRGALRRTASACAARPRGPAWPSIPRACTGFPSVPKKAARSPRRSSTRVPLLSAARRARRRRSMPAATFGHGRSMLPSPCERPGPLPGETGRYAGCSARPEARCSQAGSVLARMRSVSCADWTRIGCSAFARQWSMSTIACRLLIRNGVSEHFPFCFDPFTPPRSSTPGESGRNPRANDGVSYSLGAELSADTVFGYFAPLTFSGGVAWRGGPVSRDRGFAAFVRVGRAF